MPSQEELRERFGYDDVTGELFWKIAPHRGVRVGRTAGCVRKKDKRKIVGYKGRYVFCYRIIWTMHHGQLPSGYVIDHLDHDVTNNRLENLRAIPSAENNRNKPRLSTNKSGYTNIHRTNHPERWVVTMYIKGKSTKVGTFRTIDEAIEAREEARRTAGYHPNHGKVIN